MSPEERRNAAIAALEAAGGCIHDIRALAQPDAPHTVAMYELSVAPPSAALTHLRSDFDAALAAVERSVAGLVPWTPEPPVFEEVSIEDDPE